jgi:hypothetical protein
VRDGGAGREQSQRRGGRAGLGSIPRTR